MEPGPAVVDAAVLYFLGGQEMTELEREARRRAGDGFVWRPFLESVISHGTPPMPVIRDILFGD